MFNEPMTKLGTRSQFSRPQLNGQHTESISPIAADGGFGPMGSDESEEDSTEADVSSIEKHEREHEHAAEEAENAFGDEFDDFEEGDDDEDFGEFDEMPNQKSIPQIADAVPVSTFDIPFVSSTKATTPPLQGYDADELGFSPFSISATWIPLTKS